MLVGGHEPGRALRRLIVVFVLVKREDVMA
jgi:hypothetical protein